MKKAAIAILFVTVSISLAVAEAPIEFDLSVEAGYLYVSKHVIQSGTPSDKGDIFDYRSQGNQNILFPAFRFQGDLALFKRHHIILLYQPLTIKTEARISGPFRYDGEDYLASDGWLDLKYGFDFWRLSYLFDIVQEPRFYFGLGFSLQIRNASIVFRTENPDRGSVQNNIGPVPILKLKLGYVWESGIFIEFEGDGFYVSDRFFKGANYTFIGYIYDLALRGGYRFHQNVSGYLNLRFLGGGAEATSDGEYTFNDLHTIGFAVGLVLHL